MILLLFSGVTGVMYQSFTKLVPQPSAFVRHAVAALNICAQTYARFSLKNGC